MIRLSVEYVGFKTDGDHRQYTLRARTAETSRDFSVNIPNALFVAGRAKFQDGPELAYQKLQREMAAHDNEPAHDTFTVTEAEFEAFKEAHRPQARPRRGNAAAAAAAAGGVIPGEPHLG
jgi:hypothetical protein